MVVTTVSPFVEDAVEALRSLLERDLPYHLAAVANKYSSTDVTASRTVPLINPVAVVYGEHANPGIGFPVIFVYTDPGAVMTAFGTADQNSGWSEYDLPITVETHLQSDDEEVVERMKDRYAEAIFATTYPNQSLDADIVISTAPRRMRRGRAASADTRILLWDIVLHLMPSY